jgi:hypothetical protein
MPISLPDFLHAQTSNYGVPDDLLSQAMEGYRQAREPKKIQQEEQQRDLYNRLLGHQGQHAADINEFYPQAQRQELEQGGLDIESKRFSNELQKRFGVSQAEAELALKQAQAKYGHIAHLTQAERNVSAMIGEENLRSPEGRRLVAALEGIPEEELGGNKTEKPNIPSGAKSMAHWPQGAVATEIKRQNEELDRIETAKQVQSGIDDARKILDAYPNMWKSFSLIMANPDDERKMSRIIGALSNEDERTAAIEFGKINAGIVNRGVEKLGSRGTNFRTKLLQKEKADLFNTPQSNHYVYDKLEEELMPQIAREPEILAIYGTHSLPRSLEHHKTSSKNLVGGENEVKALRGAQAKSTAELDRERSERLAKNILKKGNQPGGSRANLRFKIGNEIVDIPANESEAFLNEFPDARPVL